MASLNSRFHWTSLSILFLCQYILCFFIEESGTYVICTINNAFFSGFNCHSYMDCVYFKYLFYYTRVVLPCVHFIPFLIWFYSNVLMGITSATTNQFVLALCPLFTAFISPYISYSRSSSYDDQYMDKLAQLSIPLQSIYMSPIFTLALMILCDTLCYAQALNDSSDGPLSHYSCQLLLLLLFIHIIFYMDLIQYISFKHLTRNITTIYHNYFISISIFTELLLFLMLVFHCFYLNNTHYPLDVKAPIIYVISIPIIFPLIYYKYYKLLDPKKLSILYRTSIFNKTYALRKHTASTMVERVYSFIHVTCHKINSYDIFYNIDCKRDCKQIPLMADKYNYKLNNQQNVCINIDTENNQFNNWKSGIIRHNNDAFLCLQYQNYFMQLSLDDKIKYIVDIAPYQSMFFTSKYSRKCPKCNHSNLYITYFCLILKIIGNLNPIWWFAYVYIYKCNSDDIKYYGANSWLFYDRNKYEHMVVVALMLMYSIVCICWIFFAIQIISFEWYYGFIRSLLIDSKNNNENDDAIILSNKVKQFHLEMVRSNAIVELLESQNIITHVAIQIVSYLK